MMEIGGSGEIQPVSEDKELEILREHYNNLDPKILKRNPDWVTWEKFVEAHRCKCPLHKVSE